MSPSSALRCPKCAGEVREGWRVCPACATPLDAETKTMFEASSASTIEEGRFPAGTVLAGRYRVLGLIGHGGMGEVYRAYDLILNQAVALKFLGRANMDKAALARFRNEVRIARQVSHPNVCRVYDIGFIESFHFLSMEYLDGEDLASLIRRIGRLPQDKAIEFARKICAGLAAAHERGVLHRDLKPANIMIDGRGQVRITDFGLAALAQEVALGDIRSGTPAYMSPEQKAGKEVTTRSDLYSLGLVLYEMFTGKRRTDTQASPGELVKDLDPAVERVILRCLEQDPEAPSFFGFECGDGAARRRSHRGGAGGGRNAVAGIGRGVGRKGRLQFANRRALLPIDHAWGHRGLDAAEEFPALPDRANRYPARRSRLPLAGDTQAAWLYRSSQEHGIWIRLLRHGASELCQSGPGSPRCDSCEPSAAGDSLLVPAASRFHVGGPRASQDYL